MVINKLLDNHKPTMTIKSSLGEITSVINRGEELYRAPPPNIDRIIRDARKEINGDIPPQKLFRALVEIFILQIILYISRCTSNM